ncbi:unnamed protein product [Camellia sinensis]
MATAGFYSSTIMMKRQSKQSIIKPSKRKFEMKLLNWMHRKLRQNSDEPFKEFTTGNSCGCFSTQPSLYEQQCYYGQKSASELKIKRVEGVYEEDSSIMINAPFDGFLTIGTFGSEPIMTVPSTPTFPTPFDKITAKETEVTENELKLINDELEKFLEAEAKEEGDELSGRSSYVSIVTICGKQIEGVDTEEYGDTVVCPLRGYLFGSSIELPETSIQVKKERTSLEQLIKTNNIVYDHSTNICEEVKNHAKGTYAMRLVRKILKKLHSSPRSSATSAGGGAAADSVATKRKIPKVGHPKTRWTVLKMFHKKVHPERSTTGEEFTKSHKCEIMKNSTDAGYNKGGPALQNKDNNGSPLRAMLKKEITNSNLTYKRLSSNGLTQKREHWIKTDADLLGVRAVEQRKLKEVAISCHPFRVRSVNVVFDKILYAVDYLASFE